MTFLTETAEIFLDFKQVGILISRFAYAIMPLGKRNDESMWTKRVKPSVPRILGASSCLFIVDKKRNDDFHMDYTSSRCRVSGGQHS